MDKIAKFILSVGLVFFWPFTLSEAQEIGSFGTGQDVVIIDSLDGGECASPFSPREYNWSSGSLPPNDKRAMLLYKDKPYSERPGPYEVRDYGHVQILNPDENERETTKYL
ncbi:MAG: hypothetical protein QME81_07015, partial [bacterium]|nr:hypothetical protein [bacterium]